MNESWKRCITDFLRSKQDRSGSEHTVMNYRSVLSHFFAQVPSPEHATRQDVEAFLHMSLHPLRSRSPSPATRNTRLAILSSFYRYASTYLIAGMPLMRTSSPTLGITRSISARAYRAFTPADLRKFFDVIPTDIRGLRDRALFACYFWTARRRSEIVNLLYGDLFQGIVIDEDGTRRTAWLYRFKGKGKTGYDVAELPIPAKSAIDRYLVASGRIATIADDDPVFIATSPDAGGGWPIDPYKPLTGRSVWVALKKYARAANLDYRRLDVHALRHTSARERYAAGQDILSLQTLLRHENVATTSVYLKRLVTPSDSGARLLEQRFQGFEW